MARSHPPTLLKLAERQIRDGRLIEKDQLIVCAASGGPDSSALVHVLATLRKRFGHRVVVVGVDHGLRADAARELALAGDIARAVGVGFDVVSVRVPRGGNLQERAREARHRALQARAEAQGAAAIAFGHTADDRAETLLIRLVRGAGPRGLGVMPASAPGIEGPTPLIRPLLAARRSDVMRHNQRHGLVTATDPSNVDRRFLRSRVRHEVLPLLEELSPQIVPHLCALSEMLGGEEDVLAGLGRAQRLELERALRDGLRGGAPAITLRLRGGRELFVRFASPAHAATPAQTGRIRAKK